MTKPLAQPLRRALAALRKYETDVDDSPTAEQRSLVAELESAISAEEKTTAATVGEAGYPSSMDISRRADAAFANRDNIIRACIDWERERVAKAHPLAAHGFGPAVAWQFQFLGQDGKWSDWITCSEDSANARAESYKANHETRALAVLHPVPVEVLEASNDIVCKFVETKPPEYAQAVTIFNWLRKVSA